ncbi:hypothetical protein AB0L75_03430 [Streptomyces sp. NPDC052101]|uniref:hypothetical protein n=1 Tax=Streptomyces sp. NPDC052101 TaxID=3155763 RepID=UPI003423FF84
MAPPVVQQLVMAQLMRHDGAMDVSPFVDRLGREFVALARIDSEDARALAAQLESAIRLTLVDTLAAAADEINRDLAQGSVELRLRGDEPNFVVTPSSPDRSSETAAASDVPTAEEGATALVTVRFPQQLKAAIERAAGYEGRSVDAWLAQRASSVVQKDRASCTAHRRGKRCRQRYTAWVR